MCQRVSRRSTITLTRATGLQAGSVVAVAARVPGRRDPLRPRVRQRRAARIKRLRHTREPRPVQCTGTSRLRSRRHGSDRRHHDVRNDVGRPFQLRDRREHQSPSADAASCRLPSRYRLRLPRPRHDTSGEDRTASSTSLPSWTEEQVRASCVGYGFKRTTGLRGECLATSKSQAGCDLKTLKPVKITATVSCVIQVQGGRRQDRHRNVRTAA